MKRQIAVNTALTLTTSEIEHARNHMDDPNYHLHVYHDDMDHTVIDPRDDEDACMYIVYDIDENDNVIPKTFKDILEELDVTGYELAKWTGVPQSTIARWVTGDRDILKAEWQTVLAICKALAVKSDWLYKRLK